MKDKYIYPGTYVEEVSVRARTIAGAKTSVTAFVDFFRRGPMNKPERIISFTEFENVFGGLYSLSEASYAIHQFFLNGGKEALIVRIAAGNPKNSQLLLEGNSGRSNTLKIKASNPGEWGNNLQVAVDHKTKSPESFNLAVREVVNNNGANRVCNTEIHRNLSINKSSNRYAIKAINETSDLIRLSDFGQASLPKCTGKNVTDGDVVNDPYDNTKVFRSLRNGNDGLIPNKDTIIDRINYLDNIDNQAFNILCLPAAVFFENSDMVEVITKATKLCERNRAFLIIDIPKSVNTPKIMSTWVKNNDILRHRNNAVFFPRLEVSDPLHKNFNRNLGASGTLAGLFARTDSSRGVWKAPAGTEAALYGVASLEYEPDDKENRELNKLGVNCLRDYRDHGIVSFGARTLMGKDGLYSEWKYIPVRRLSLYIEESLYRGTKWSVFEPNDETLWTQIRSNATTFLHNLFRQGAFQGTTPREAYFVKCDNETNTEQDINLGVVNIIVGFAPLRPAEFIIIKIKQIAART